MAQGVWTYYTDELPGVVFDMTQDEYGNYWFATDNAVCQIDTNGIWHTLVDSAVWDSTMFFKNQIVVDKENNKWFVGVAMSNPTKEYVVKYDDTTFTYYNPSGKEKDTWIFGLGIDSLNNIWAGSDANFAYWLDGETWHQFFVPGTYIYDSINDIKMDQKGNLFFAHGNGISSLKYGYMWGDGMREVLELDFDSQNRLWFATLLDGIGMYDGINWTLYTTMNNLKSNLLTSVAIDSNQNIWISYAGYYGISKFDSNNWQHFTKDSILIDKFVEDIFVDINGNIWFATFGDGVIVYHDTTTTKVQHQPYSSSIPKEFTLFQNYPNPFNSETEIRFQLPAPGQTKLVVYNLLGQKIRTLVREMKQAGNYSVRWDGRDENGSFVASGVYVYIFQTSKFMDVKKMVLLR